MRHAVSLATLFALAAPGLAVPLPKGRPAQLAPLDDKYFLDDADLVAVINVRQILASPAYRNVFAKQLGALLRDETVAATLKEFGLDPMKDIDRICALVGRSNFENIQHMGIVPAIVVQGRFAAAKVAAGAKKLAKATTDHGSAKIYELALPGLPVYAALLDKSHVILAPRKEQVQAALDKAAGKTKTVLKSKAFAEMLGRINPQDSLSVVATGDTVVGGGRSVANGMVTVTVHTLAESAGIQELTVVSNTKNDVRVKVTMTATDAAKAKQIETTVTNGIREMPPRIEKEMPQLATALKAVKVVRKDRVVTVEGQDPGEAVRDLIFGAFGRRSSGPPVDRPAVERKR